MHALAPASAARMKISLPLPTDIPALNSIIVIVCLVLYINSYKDTFVYYFLSSCFFFIHRERRARWVKIDIRNQSGHIHFIQSLYIHIYTYIYTSFNLPSNHNSIVNTNTNRMPCLRYETMLQKHLPWQANTIFFSLRIISSLIFGKEDFDCYCCIPHVRIWLLSLLHCIITDIFVEMDIALCNYFRISKKCFGSNFLRRYINILLSL